MKALPLTVLVSACNDSLLTFEESQPSLHPALFDLLMLVMMVVLLVVLMMITQAMLGGNPGLREASWQHLTNMQQSVIQSVIRV